MARSVEEVRPVLEAVKAELLGKANVVAAGIGYKVTNGRKTDELSILCSVETKKPLDKLSANERVLPEISGIPTDVIPTGPISIFQEPTGRFRPAPGGVSLGHHRVTAGTLGCLVQKKGQLYILSNNHILANSNNASAGDPVIQPALHDGGNLSDDEIANLSEFIPIRFEDNENKESSLLPSGWVTKILNRLAELTHSKTRFRHYHINSNSNRVDCAIARPKRDDLVDSEILEVGPVNGMIDGELGMKVQKSGRTTGLTTGFIEQVDVTARVNFGTHKVALFEDQLMAGGMSRGGDSGSAVLDMDNNLTGLLFAGSTNTTLINRIQNVFDQLKLELPS